MPVPVQERLRWRASAGWLAALLCCAGVLLGVAARPALAAVNEYAPDGTLRATYPRIPSVTCIDPSGQHLITPGAGMWGPSGKPLASSWAGVAGAHCAADGQGHVYLPGRVSNSDWTITKYGITGTALQTFHITPLMSRSSISIALAPDECTIYYGAYAALGSDTLGRFDVCTNAQLPMGSAGSVDDLRILPNWDVLGVDDGVGFLLDPAGSEYYFPPYQTDWLRSLALDPDGTSVWICCGAPTGGGAPKDVFHYDIASGQLLGQITQQPDATGPTGTGFQRGDLLGPGVQVYAPPLTGSADVAPTADEDNAGTAEAFRTTAGYGGRLSRLHVYLDAGSQAGSVVVGVYSDQTNHPSALLASGTVGGLRAGAWNYVDVPAVTVTAGQRYWLAVLSPAGAGTLRVRDASSGGRSETSRQQTLTALPARWTTGRTWASGSLSAYGS